LVVTKFNRMSGHEHLLFKYYREFEEIILLKDGNRVLIRPLIPCDYKKLDDFFNSLNSETLYSRYFTSGPHIKRQEIRRLLNGIYQNRLILVAELLQEGNPIIGVAELCASNEEFITGEAAIIITDKWQGKHAGIQILDWLRRVAQSKGLKKVIGYCLVTNRRVISLLKKFGYQYTTRVEGATLYFEVTLDELVE
jgi:acetyltransferase